MTSEARHAKAHRFPRHSLHSAPLSPLPGERNGGRPPGGAIPLKGMGNRQSIQRRYIMEKKTVEENMSLYNQVRCVPKDAISPITGGPMKGKSNINPQWRLETLTRLFGPIGVEFRIEQVSRWTESTADGEVAVFCEVNLYVKNGDEWSAPIFGQGGSMLVRRR